MRKILPRATAGFFSGLVTATSKRTTNHAPSSSTVVDAKHTINTHTFMMPTLPDASIPGFFQPTHEHQSLSYIDRKSAVYITSDLKNMNVLCRHQEGIDDFIRAISQLPGLSVKYSPPKNEQDYAKIEISGLYDVCHEIANVAAQIKAKDPSVSKNPGLLERRDYYTNTKNYAPELLPLYQKYDTLQSDRAFGVGHTTTLCLEFFLTNVDVNSERYRNLILDVVDRAREIRSEHPDITVPNLPRRSM